MGARHREKKAPFRVLHLEKTKDWDRLAQLMHQFDVDCCVIDALPQKRLAPLMLTRRTVSLGARTMGPK